MSSTVKKRCPLKKKCYQKNPIHFGEMSHPHLEKLLVNQLEGMIEIPEVLDFACNDRSQLLDQLKVLQMVLRKEREKHRENSVVITSDQLIKTQSTAVSDAKEDLKKKIDGHVNLKRGKAQKRQDKLKQMDTEAQTPSRTLANKDGESSENTKVIKGNQEPSTFGSVTKNPSKETGGDSQSSSTMINKQSRSAGKSIMDIFEACNSDKSRAEVRKKAIQIMRRSGYAVSIVEPGKFAIKYASSAPYHLFFTRVKNSEETYNQQFSITFPEILDRSLGEIVNSLHLNFIVDVGWLWLQYLLAGQRTVMMILYGDRVDKEKLGYNITMIHVDMPRYTWNVTFGCHHSKIMILQYKDGGIRVVISTANLHSDDWENRTQGLWISPHLPPLSESANSDDGESPTGFKMDFERYLRKYTEEAGHPLTPWISAVKRADFSAVNVFFVASVPGTYKDIEVDSWGHRKLADVLSRHATLPPDAPQWPIVAQSSSIGIYGPNFKSWLSKEMISCMSCETTKNLKSHPKFCFIYPSIENYKRSFDYQNLNCCLGYSVQMHSKQEWIKSYMYQWKATRTGRDRAMPHIKCYTRISPDLKSIPWFVLTSSNLSKAAWGVQRGNHHILNFEAGVIFIPKFITGTTTFPIENEKDPAVPVFPIPYDLPLCRYDLSDTPFVSEFLQDLTDPYVLFSQSFLSTLLQDEG